MSTHVKVVISSDATLLGVYILPQYLLNKVLLMEVPLKHATSELKRRTERQETV